jgi:F-type H+-transporting ATPase subunit epsilon
MSDKIPESLRLKVITAKRLIVDAEAEFVSLPSLEGSLGILPGHRIFVVGIGKGRVSYRKAGREESFAVHGGYAEVGPEEVLIITEAVEDEDAGGSAA